MEGSENGLNIVICYKNLNKTGEEVPFLYTFVQGRAEDFFTVTFFLSAQVNSLSPHLFSHLTLGGGKEFTWGGEEIMIIIILVIHTLL